MTRDDIIRMAREAGLEWVQGLSGGGYHINHPNDLARFAALVAAHEREECAREVEDQSFDQRCDSTMARSQCAAAIRARKETQ